MQVSNTKQTEFNDLPIELTRFIFKHLQLSDLMVCRLVCKRFKDFANEFEFEELVVNDKKYETTANHWYSTNRPIDLKNSIKPDHFRSFDFVFLKLRKSLKKLSFRCLDDQQMKISKDDSFLDLLKMFKELVHLELPYRLNLDHKKNELYLPNLKVLKIQIVNRKLQIETPKLEILKCDCIKNLVLIHPTTVTHLSIKRFSKDVLIFKNLRHLRLSHSMMSSSLKWMNDLKKLKNLDFYDETNFDFKSWISPMKLLMKERIKLKRIDLQITFLGVNLTDETKNYQPFDGCGNGLGFQIRNYSILSNDLTMATRIDYTDLMYYTKGRLPDDFFDLKFINIRILKVRSRVIGDGNYFCWFIKKLKFLEVLHLIDSTLNASFYEDVLSIHAPNLKQLLIKEEYPFDRTFDLSFLFNFKELAIFETNQFIKSSFGFVIDAFINLRCLKKFSFNSFLGEIGIIKHIGDKYGIWAHSSLNDCLPKYTIGFDDLKELCTSFSSQLSIDNRTCF